ncbi:MAG: 4'-phosphopantetheinyl transferase superfamily protein [Lysobacteraceae bacterium]
MPNPAIAAATGSGIDIWLTFYDRIADESLLSRLRELLSEEERRRELRYFFADDRKRYLVTRAMVRTVLSRYAPVAPEDWVFSTNGYGRPEIANPFERARGLTFNISHTRGLIALGVVGHRALGVDVENIATRQVSLGIADRFFAPTEVAELSATPIDRQQDRFFEYWTFKESYIKARGMGLSIPLDRFSFRYPHERAVGLSIQPELEDDAERWSFWQYRPTSEHLLAICAERTGAERPDVTIRKLVPTVAEEAFDLNLLRVSDI